VQCIHTTYDLLEGHIIVSMLRENDIEAWLFNADFVRQNWLQSIAYGGFRIMVADSCVVDAIAQIKNYKSGTMSLTDASTDICPRCGSLEIQEDPRPRRNVFIFLIVEPVFLLPFFLAKRMSVVEILVVIAMTFVSYGFLFAFLPAYFKSRYRCTNCGNRWKRLPHVPYSELAQQAEAAESP
jgi:predicted RNA-binding Zn-ribbon protein involved in translation (DUF1610 family)